MMNKQTAKRIGDDVKAALEAVAKRHGLVVEVQGGSFDPGVGVYKPKVVFKEADSTKQEFLRYARIFGISPDAFEKTFTFPKVGGKAYTIVGIRPSASKRPILAASVTDSKLYTFAVRETGFAVEIPSRLEHVDLDKRLFVREE